jgi:hypothetical protein
MKPTVCVASGENRAAEIETNLWDSVGYSTPNARMLLKRRVGERGTVIGRVGNRTCHLCVCDKVHRDPAMAN